MDITDAVSSAMVWASDSNAYVCTEVMPNGVAATESVDLSGAYYTAVLPTVKLQFAKAGYRLAAWLNLIATGSTGL
jgi:S1/P1 Nuclease